MIKQYKILMAIFSLVLILGTWQPVSAKVESGATSVTKFNRIEQPLSSKILVVLAGLGLIGADLWWFLFNPTQAKKATANQGIQEIKITVDGGYSPDNIIVELGKPVKLNFLRKDSSHCLEKVLLPDFNQAVDLPLNEVISIEFTPQQSGEFTFHCDMNMYRGVIKVEQSNE